MRNTKHVFVGAVLGSLMAAGVGAVSAEEGAVNILAPWTSEGSVYQIEPQVVLFQGEANGIMYIDGGEGSLDAAVFVCPSTNVLNLEKETTEAIGHCIIQGAEGKGTIFARYECKGPVGGCEGKFTLTGGTDDFEGITGSGEMLVRTALTSLVADLESGSVVRGAAGLAVWPELKYKIPE